MRKIFLALLLASSASLTMRGAANRLARHCRHRREGARAGSAQTSARRDVE